MTGGNFLLSVILYDKIRRKKIEYKILFEKFIAVQDRPPAPNEKWKGAGIDVSGFLENHLPGLNSLASGP